MPYIKTRERIHLDMVVEKAMDSMIGCPQDERDGRMNYLITNLLNKAYGTKYQELNSAIGVLEAVKLETYRRRIAPYEDKKSQENGDIQWK